MTTHAAERYLLNELAGADRDAFEEHFFACADCAEDVRAGALMRDGVRAGLIGDARPAGRPANVIPIERSRRWRVSVAAPWAVAATLALVAGYQSLWVVPGLRQQTATAATPVLLRPASRGAVTTVTRPSSGVVAFALDLNAANTGAPLSYDLRTVDGTSVASGAVAAPPAGTPLILVVPVTLLEAAGDYLLVIRDSGVTNPPVSEYRFAIANR